MGPSENINLLEMEIFLYKAFVFNLVPCANLGAFRAVTFRGLLGCESP